MTPNLFKFSTLAAFGVVVVGAAAWYFIAPPDEAPAMPGSIEGMTSYPSEYIPTQIICAEPVGGGAETCIQSPEGDEALIPSWTLPVAPGQYYVSAHLKDPAEMDSSFGDYRAYYTTYVQCGMEATCKDHSKIPVTVVSGEATRDIRPFDWYMR